MTGKTACLHEVEHDKQQGLLASAAFERVRAPVRNSCSEYVSLRGSIREEALQALHTSVEKLQGTPAIIQYLLTTPFVLIVKLLVRLAGGTLADRVCVSSEISLYFTNLATVDTPPPNINCNATSWPQACEAGWAGRATGNITLQSDFVPTRNLDPLPCCAGFFCPRGLSCMIRKSKGTSQSFYMLTAAVTIFPRREQLYGANIFG